MRDIQALLTLAIKHVADGEMRIARQREIIVRLDKLGHPIALGDLLDTMLVSLRHMIEDRDHIQKLRNLEIQLQYLN